MKKKSSNTVELKPRLRVVCGDDIALGPGKIDLLEQLQATGSIAEAAKRLGMSYMRAWLLIKTMNRCFKEPLVLAARGGRSFGGAQVTETGRKALDLYRQMEIASLAAMKTRWTELRKILRR